MSPTTRTRRLLALGLLAVLAATAGCSSVLGPGPVDEEALTEDETYDWNGTGDERPDAFLTVNKNNYTAVYDVGNKSTGTDGGDGKPTIELYERDALGTENPLEVSALQFRYENGTRVHYVRDGDEVETALVYPNGSQRAAPGKLDIERNRKRAVVTLPASEGQLAYTTGKNGKQVGTPTFVTGHYEMVLPANAQVGIPLLAQVSPREDATREVDGRVVIVWDNIDRQPSVVVRYYLERDILLFGGLVALMVVVGLAGAAYYFLQIRETVRKREEVGLDVDIGDDEGRKPPPGMG